MNDVQACEAPLQDQRLGDIATSLPGATAVFRKYKLDFCCGGAVSLGEAATKKRLPVDDVVAELQALSGSDTQPLPGDVPALIEHIVSRFHEVHRRELPELIRLATRVEAVHRQHPEVPAGMAVALKDLMVELDAHMAKEEGVLFPLMRAGAPMVVQPIAVMRHEHDEHGERLHRLDALAHHGEAPADACATWRALYAGWRKFVDDLMQHIHIENNILFRRFEPGAASGSSMQ